jgi:hypothetical protein
MKNYVILMPNGKYVESVDDNLVFTTENKKDANIFKLKDAADHAAIMVQGRVVTL